LTSAQKRFELRIRSAAEQNPDHAGEHGLDYDYEDYDYKDYYAAVLTRDTSRITGLTGPSVCLSRTGS